MGLDVGSTTVKLVVINEDEEILYSRYERHLSDVRETVKSILEDAYGRFGQCQLTIMVTGSGGMFVEKYLSIDFIQEVIAGTRAINSQLPDIDVAIELGGEDSKITYLSGNIDQRMNSICAGGTGAFIDQMASLLQTDAAGLNELARGYEKIYPIASRCGVFAKTDIQALVNQGAKQEDIAASVFQSVVNQTISNLAQGRPIRGSIALLGGPIHFLDQLEERFRDTLGEEENKFFVPANGQVFVALGAALGSKDLEAISFNQLMEKLDEDPDIRLDRDETLDPLFKDEKDRRDFESFHKKDPIDYGDLKSYKGKLYLGIDAGSTTSKVVVLDEDKRILYSHYANNQGRPLELMVEVLSDIYDKKNPQAEIVASGITGYGEDFIKKALKVDVGEVETIAHYRAARYFNEDVDFILDIGGQDMKAIHIRDGVIDSIQLNEACSSGCGSFIETFAKSLNLSVEEFQKRALDSTSPVDLGSRCTVFMNSKVKQAQKEGASVEDIAAGLCYSVIKNAIWKVIKLRDPADLGENIVVQGGTFYGDGILRSFEKVTSRRPIRPSIAGLMGAMGMALIAMEKSTGYSSILDEKELKSFSYRHIQTSCKKCSNQCSLNVNIFPDGERFITGNRCERGAGLDLSKKDMLSNLYAYKYERVFDYRSLEEDSALMTVGIPRVLNIYENYPLWHSFFTSLGYRVVLSDHSSREVYEKGLASITSETACYPAKLSHGHIEDLIEKDVDFIFYPSVFYEKKEYKKADNHVNCPVVTGYPEVIRNNVEGLEEKNIRLVNPFISLENKKKLAKRLYEELDFLGRDKKEIRNALDRAWEEEKRYKSDVRKKGQEVLREIEEKGQRAIVLAGRPYHIDPEINHGIPELINSLGWAVLSEDSILDEKRDLEDKTRVLDQWVYHSRLYRAAEIVGERDDLELVQLNSFGCGLDAVTTDQVNDILRSRGKIYTVLKIDEVSNLGAVKIRLRSLIQALDDGKRPIKKVDTGIKEVAFTKEMKKDYTLLCPRMLEEHFEIMRDILHDYGYRVEFLTEVNQDVINAGLKYVNNDACYPSIITIGQMLEAIESKRYDKDRLALVMSQTGGACRASNYVGFIRKALKDSGNEQIPLIALSVQGIEDNPGITVGPLMMKKLMIACLYGDLIMRLSNRTRPYELTKGDTDRLKDYWIARCRKEALTTSKKNFELVSQKIIDDFENIEADFTRDLPRVGIVGEILVKYLPAANNHLQKTLEKEGAEVVIPDFLDFFMYCCRNQEHKCKLLSKGNIPAWGGALAIWYIDSYRDIVRNLLKDSKRYDPPAYIKEVENYAEDFVSLANQYGEGWLLTGEMTEMIDNGVENIVCIQPFGCLPNHITGKGVIKKVKEVYPQANIVPIDYDPGASEVNQINRIKLMLSRDLIN